MTPLRPAWLALLVLALAALRLRSSTDVPRRLPGRSPRRPPRPATPPRRAPTGPGRARARPPACRDSGHRARPRTRSTLEKVKFDEFLKRIAANKKAKYTIVDAWATWCGPCKENFPHLVEMHKKYGDKGLAVVSLSFDDPADAKAVDDARAFLAREEGRPSPTSCSTRTEGVGFEKLDINAIPAVFLYRPRRQGSQAVHDGRPEQSVHLRRSREDRRRPARRQVAD